MFVVSVALGTAQNENFLLVFCACWQIFAYRSSYWPAFFFTANGSHLSDALHGHLLIGRARNSRANENMF